MVLEFVPISDGIWKVKNDQKPFSVLERQHMQNQTISELYTDKQNSIYSSDPNEIFNSTKKFYENLYSKENVSRDAIDEFLNKIPIKK